MRAFVYILGASSNADKIKCKVPYEIDKHEIFFGPCKKKLRQKLKSEVDENGNLNSETYFIGLNARNSKKDRKIVWAGKIKKYYTFRQAYKQLSDNKYLPIRTGECFPLHVKPIKNGYQLTSKLHSKNCAWVSDLTSTKNLCNGDKECNSITLKKGYTFDRDICFLFSNIFFANRFDKGIEINKEILSIFIRTQPNKKDIDSYAVFGYNKNETVGGKAGSWLELNSEATNEIINIIKKQAKKIKNGSNLASAKTYSKVIQTNRGGCK